jgi:hypothetical protein
MSRLERMLRSATVATGKNLRERRYLTLPNYVSDIIAGNISRTPVYAVFDNLAVGVSDEKILASGGNALLASVCGYSLAYSFGNSMLATVLGDTYQRHAKKIDAIYSAIMTFGFGMAINTAAGYNTKQALFASAARGIIAIPLGPITRYYTDAFRQMRDEPATAKDTSFKGRGLLYGLPRAAAMTLVPVIIAGVVLYKTPDAPKAAAQQSIYTVPVKQHE